MSNYRRNRNSSRNSNNNHKGGRNRNSRRNYYRNRGRGNSNRRRRFGSEKIPHEKYIAVADKGYVPPSIYVEDRYYNDLEVEEKIKQNISNKGYKHPTKIQNEAIPVILQGRDILGLASTGSGKTAAFLIPLLHKIRRDRSQRCLIIVPTRELASQIQDELTDLSRGMNIYSTLIIGGQGIGRQISQLRRNPQFVIGTPGRLKDHTQRGTLDLSQFNNIVLDEVDRMLDMGFIPDITFLISKLTRKKQTLFFSATMSKDAEKIAQTLLHKPVRVQVEKESPLKSVNQNIVRVKQPGEKPLMLKELLDKDEFEKVLVFSRTKRGADKLTKKLFKTGLRVDSIHGDKSQNKRLRVLNMFKTNQIDVLIATDVAARGLDIPNVSHVINYDEPENYKDYIHRIGRTGRAGKSGNALTFVIV